MLNQTDTVDKTPRKIYLMMTHLRLAEKIYLMKERLLEEEEKELQMLPRSQFMIQGTLMRKSLSRRLAPEPDALEKVQAI